MADAPQLPDEAEVRAVMGENAVRVLRAGVMPMTKNPPPLGEVAARRADGGGGRP